MTDLSPSQAFLDELSAAARAAEAAEEQCRREAAGRIEQLARERAYAYRRLNTAKSLAHTAARCENRQAACAAQWSVLCERLGWEDASEGGRAEVRQALQPVFTAIDCQAVQRQESGKPTGEEIKTSVEALKQFEAWYEQRFGHSFWSLFDRYSPETPVVDF